MKFGFHVLDTPLRGLADISEGAAAIARSFGSIMPGRFGRLVEEVVPTTADEAVPRSLSEKYGTGALPLHMDTAHRLRPARTMVLGCVNAGLGQTSTTLIDLAELQWAPRELQLLKTAVFLVRTGRRSFYSSIFNECRPFVRFDPGCMEPTDKRSESALSLFSDRLSSVPHRSVNWIEGRFLILDNWRMFHGRSVTPSSSGRLLVRSCAQ